MATKIKLEMTTIEVLMAMSEGNPGALWVCAALLSEAPRIDPDNALGGLGPILMLDTLGLYGSTIWILFKDICEQNMTKMIGLLRANQLGILPRYDLLRAVGDGPGIDVDGLVTKVREELPNFARA